MLNPNNGSDLPMVNARGTVAHPWQTHGTPMAQHHEAQSTTRSHLGDVSARAASIMMPWVLTWHIQLSVAELQIRRHTLTKKTMSANDDRGTK